MYMTVWRNIKAVTNGWELKKRGIPAGPEYKMIIERLRAAWLDGEIHTPKEEKTLLDKLIPSLK